MRLTDLFGEGFVTNDDFGDDDQGVNTCPDMLRCFIQIASNGIRTPDYLGLQAVSYLNTQWAARTVYDLSFFIVLGALLFNMVTGIIVDTFGELREASRSRAERLRDVCFICNTDRNTMDDMGAGFDFDIHKEREHNIWNYVYFIKYLASKDPMEYNGVESNIHKRIADNDTSWFPNRKWLKKQQYEMDEKKKQAEEITQEGREAQVDEQLNAMQSHLEDILQRLDGQAANVAAAAAEESKS